MRVAAHGRRGSIGGGLLVARSRNLMLHPHHLCTVAGGGIVAAGYHGGRRDGNVGVGHGHGGGASDILLLDDRNAGTVAHGGRIHGGCRVS